jgi:plasmid segregation protein ParM
MTTAPIVRAIDIGYGNTKFTVDDRLQTRLFPSLAPRAKSQIDSRGFALRERRTVPVHVDGVVFEVGPDTILFDEVPVLHKDYVETPEYRALMYGAFDSMQVRRIDLLVLGLPVHLHASKAARLQELFAGTHTIRPGLAIEIDDVAVMPQPLGGLIAHNEGNTNWEITRDRTVLLVDPGYFTFDWMVTRNMQEIPGLNGGVECGVSDYLKAILDAINAEFGETYSNLRRLDDALRAGQSLAIGGRHIDPRTFRHAGAGVIDRAMKALRNSIRSVDDIDSVCLVGGGAEYFREALASTFRNVAIDALADPVCANARGFHMMGEAFLSSGAAA